MYLHGKDELVKISAYAGGRPDYVQGGGGNTSVKLDETLMGIKASGYTLGEITPDKGYVTVDYNKIRAYYNEVDAAEEKDFEKESLAVNLDSVCLLDGMENKRPSVEVGFHSFLKTCVIHTHSVYANILCCSEEGESIAKEILPDVRYIFVPYIDPGFSLTLAIMEALKAYERENGAQPDVIFMKNHGVIVHGDDSKNAIALHEKINEDIRSYFSVSDFPAPGIKETAAGYISNSKYLMDFIAQRKADESYFSDIKLYPDQLVYIGSKLGSTIQIQKGGIIYNAGEKEAMTMEETLLGVAFVIDSINKADLTLSQMDESAANFINNWESEKYRSKMVK